MVLLYELQGDEQMGTEGQEEREIGRERSRGRWNLQ